MTNVNFKVKRPTNEFVDANMFIVEVRFQTSAGAEQQ